MPTQNLTDDIKRRATWSVIMGVVTAVLGLFLIAYPLAAATITTLLFGWVLIFVGIAEFVFALHSQTIGRFFLKVLLGVLYGIAGVIIAFAPLTGVVALTLLLGILLLSYAVIDAVVAYEVRPVEGWGWFLFDAAAAALMGILILARWPSSSAWAIGTLVGVAVLIGGISRIMIATKIRRGMGKVEQFPRAA